VDTTPLNLLEVGVPSLRRRTSQPLPRRGDSIWCSSLGNGKIIYVDYAGEEIHCAFQGGERDEFSFDEMIDKWTDKFGGVWYLEDR